MATTLEIQTESGGTVATLDKLLGTWVTIPEMGGRVTETFRFIIKNTATSIRSDIRDLQDLLAEQDLWHQLTMHVPAHFLVYATDGETDKRAIIYSWELIPVDHSVADRELARGVGIYDLAITRGPWEYMPANVVTESSATNLSTLGGAWFPSAVGGEHLAGRLERLRLQVAAGDTLERVWVGIRPRYEGYSSFGNPFECEAGSNSTDTSDSVVAGTSGGSVCATDFSTDETMTDRFSLNYVQIGGGTETSYHGHWLILLRARVTNADTNVGLKVSWGYYQASLPKTFGNLTSITGDTDFKLLPMGVMTVPTIGYRTPILDLDTTSGTDLLQQFRLTLWAARYEGTGDLQSDCFVLVPAEHQVFLENCALQGGYHLSVTTDEAGEVAAVTQDTSQANFVGFPGVSDTGMLPWGLPAEGGLIVVAAENSSSNVVTDEFDAISIDALYKRVITYNDV